MAGFAVSHQRVAVQGVADLLMQTLQDTQQYADPQGLADAAGISCAQWSLFGQLWPAGRQLPAYITYFTMASDINGEMATFADIYGRDAPVLASLDKPRVRNRSNAIDDEVIVIEDDLQDS